MTTNYYNALCQWHKSIRCYSIGAYTTFVSIAGRILPSNAGERALSMISERKNHIECIAFETAVVILRRERDQELQDPFLWLMKWNEITGELHQVKTMVIGFPYEN